MNAALIQRLPRPLRSLTFNLNAPLVVGGALVLVLVGAALFAPLIAPYSPIDNPGFYVNGIMEVRSPLPPGTRGFLLGTDSLGRDMLSRLLYGARYTLIMTTVIAIARVLIGATFGMLAAWWRGGKRIFSILTSASSAVPGVFFAFIAIPLIDKSGVGHIAPNPALSDVIVFMIALSLTGWAESAVRCRLAIRALRAQPFIESAYLIGRGNWGVLFKHVLPNLRSVLLMEGAAAFAASLLIIAELGFFSIFIGGASENPFSDKYPDPITAEWGSMFAKGLRDRSTGAWLVVEPLLAFTLSILAFQLLSEGLRRQRR